ncbi:MAG: hypothetical protein F4Z50_15490, partial [Gemmatimonadetes bacterium]|nr:hypothetical protein [Gemmatimonadota bacterium]
MMDGGRNMQPIGQRMRRPVSRPWSAVLWAILLVACSDEPEPTAPTTPPPPLTPADSARQVLIAFYNATGGPSWLQNRNWNTASDLSTWYGVETRGGRVTQLVLGDNNLVGTLPAELGDLALLHRLVLNGNQISGRIPPELGILSNLTMLNLRGNDLEGPIPPELGALARLDTLDLFNAGVSGAIPPSLGNLSSLQSLTLGWNRLSGSIPAELGRLDNATYMNFSRNELTGTIPPELGDLDSIELLSVSRNDLTGAIPTELGQLATLERLYLYDNRLTGGIPPALGQLSQLDVLWIHQNDLAGPIPDEFANLTALEDLRAHENSLSGAIPSFLGGFPLRILLLHDNTLSGGMPAEIGEIGTLESLTLNGNRELAGLLPRSLLDLEYLEDLWFDDTGLCPQVDEEFRKWMQALPNLVGAECDPGEVERLALAEFHDMTGGASWANRGAWLSDADVGDWYGVMSEGGHVVELKLPGNALAGPFPAEIANLTQLRALDLSGNDLSGAFPNAVAGLSELTELRVGGNPGLEGALPFGLRGLDHLRVLDFDGTGLCASPSANFQAWFAAIAETAGATCDNPDQVTVSLEMVYLTQSVQTPSRRVLLVANRDALLRAFVTAEEPRGYFEPDVLAVFTGPGGDELHRVVMTRGDNQIPAEAREGELGSSYNAVIPADVLTPGVRMFVEVDSDGDLPLTAESRTRFPATGSDSLRIVEVPPLQLTLVPVLEEAAPDTSILAWVRGVSAESPQVGLLKHSFPLAEFSVRPRDPFYTSLDITTTAGQVALFGELEALRTAEGGRGYYYGVAADLGSVGGRGQLPGWVSIGVPSPYTLTHEVGHNVSLRHAPCGNPPGVNPVFPYPDGSIGVWGYDFRSGSVMSPDRSEDIMTYCRTRPWISDYHYRNVISHRAALARGIARAGMTAADRPSDMLVLWGGVADGELQLEPVYSTQATPRVPEERGPYRITGIGSDGRTLWALDFMPGEDGHGGRHFFFMVPIEPDWEDSLDRIVLTGPEGQVAVDREDERAITVVTERGTGRIRAILRDWD